MARKLVVLHIDGVSANTLQKALDAGDMPHLQHLIDSEAYEIHPYRCGLPSTTPFGQAGVLYGDNSEIPSFRWWDREREVLVKFGPGSTFAKVADKYFKGCRPLTEGGACIAACYPAGAADDFGIAYQDRTYGRQEKSRSAATVLVPYLANPVHLADWVWQTVAVVGRTAQDYAVSRSEGRHPARAYLVTNVVEEIFVHHLTRYAVQKAMREGYSPIYAGFYAYDEVAHAFGPKDPSALRVMTHVDHTIHKIARSRQGRYELVVLSDHGHVDTIPFPASAHRAWGEVLAGLLPGHRVLEMNSGKAYGPPENMARAQVNVTAAGGLSHVYFAKRTTRMTHRDLMSAQPSFMAALAEMPQVALVMARDGEQDVFMCGRDEHRGNDVKRILAPYDDPDILFEQLSRLNSFQKAGDVVVFGAFIDGKQVNFENQAGGHASIGGEQLHPFVLTRKEWGIDTSRVRGAHELHPILSRLRDELAA
ncbi:MAG TPA: alkaline phosphatase family protein [Candidatus Dormibacteraeota bacterium]|nr:alkaline phosphatase family protein [Candidatus Dormibacteraeota bacterium]